MGTIRIILTSGLILLILFAISFAADPIVKLENIRTDKFEYEGFELDSDGKFDIEAVGFRGRNSGDFYAQGWIISSETREPVWTMTRRNSDREGRKGLFRSNETINLKKGKYEIYYYAAGKWSGSIIINGGNIIEFLGDLFDGESHRRSDIEDYEDDYFISVTPESNSYKGYKSFKVDGKIPNALIQHNKVGDSEYIKEGFELDKDTEFRVYALCEYPSGYDNPVDRAWIVDNNSKDIVWEMDRWNTDDAGGGDKNKYTNETIELKKGKYVLYYVTDGSHSYEDFNVMPPYDPINWGYAIIPTSKTDKEAFHTFEPENRGEALIDLTRARDDDYLSQPFHLKKDMSLHVFCIGEYGSGSRSFVDNGWIEDANTGKIVWEMTKRNTEHAGGGSKNRMFDGIITLDKGYYIANYTTDGSHSYNDWNATAPYEGRHWGLSVYPGADFNKSKFELVNETELQKDTNVLVKLTKLRDRERRSKKFKLNKRTKIRIFAVGEGDRDEMYDFGWVTSTESSRAVWEMTWRNTEPAGGAKKNRLYNDTIILEAGTYVVNFVTDGSHSFNDWNSTKPRNSSKWGITVSID